MPVAFILYIFLYIVWAGVAVAQEPGEKHNVDDQGGWAVVARHQNLVDKQDRDGRGLRAVEHAHQTSMHQMSTSRASTHRASTHQTSTFRASTHRASTHQTSTHRASTFQASEKNNINVQDILGRTPLMRAVLYEPVKTKVQVVQSLLAQNTDINVTAAVNLQDHFGHTALFFAAATPRDTAANKVTAAVVKLLLAHGARVDLQNKLGQTALMGAAQRGATDVLQILMESINCEGASCDEASCEGTATYKRCDRIDCKTKGRGLGAVDLKPAGLEAIRLLNLKDHLGYTALMYATLGHHKNATEYLLARGARVNMQNNLGQTALMGASWCGHLELMQSLLNAGARVNAQDYQGDTVLIHVAASYCLVDGPKALKTLQLLLSRGARRDIKNKSGYTALDVAQKYGRTQSAQLLLDVAGRLKAQL